MKKLLTLIGAAAVAVGANASGITIDSVVQRWPWNNKLDITYTVTDGQTLTADGTGDVYCKIVFNATIGGQTYAIDGVTDIGADAGTGTHTVTWKIPDTVRVKDLNCTMTATLLSSDTPSGDDYMVIDLDTGTVSYEGMRYSQTLSAAYYNTGSTYKTDKMVLRKVPRWAKRSELPNVSALPADGYPTGDNSKDSTNGDNTRAYWNTDKDFYIGVFAVTDYQYSKITGAATATATAKPKVSVAWNGNLRGQVDPLLPVEPASNGKFLQRLNAKTKDASGLSGFDLPTEVMFEIAERAGTVTKWYWGDTYDSAKVVNNSVGALAEVGTKDPNAWGLYDMAGNTWEWCLDVGKSPDDLADNSDAFTPNRPEDLSNYLVRRIHGGGTYSQSNSGFFSSSQRVVGYGYSQSKSDTGFRVAYIAK